MRNRPCKFFGQIRLTGDKLGRWRWQQGGFEFWVITNGPGLGLGSGQVESINGLGFRVWISVRVGSNLF